MCRRAQPCSCRGCSGWAGRGRLSLQHSTPGSGAGSPPKGHGEQSPKPWDQGTVRGPRSLQRGTAHATWAGSESPGWGMALRLGPRGAFPGRPLRQPECPSLQQSPGAADAHPGRACSHRTAEAARLARPGPRGAAVGAGRTRFPGAPHPHLPGGCPAASKRDCLERFGARTLERITRDDDVICTTEYSRIVPLENGEVGPVGQGRAAAGRAPALGRQLTTPTARRSWCPW